MELVKTFQSMLRPDSHTRRAVVAGMGGVAFSGVLSPAQASKKTRKKVKRARKKGDRKCRRQDGQCVQAMTDLCTAGNTDPADAAACITTFSACCAFLGDCQSGSYLDCMFAA